MSETPQPETPSHLSEAWYQSIVHASPDAVVTMDLEGRVVDWSPRAEALFGWTRTEAVGRLLGNLIIPPQYRDVHWQGLEQYRRTGKAPILNQRLEMTALHRDGTEFAIELSVTITRLSERVLFTGFVRDITQRKQTEDRFSRRTMETRLLNQATMLSATSDTLEEALQNCVEVMCSITGWPVGHALLVDESTGVLRSADIWHVADEEQFRSLRAASQHKEFRRGEGLPGRIWKEGEAVWSTRPDDDERIGQVLDSSGRTIGGAFGFPVTVEGETVAVLEFFSPNEVAPDPQLLMLVGGVGTQLGRVIEHRHWEDERAHLAAIVDSSYDAIIGKDGAGRIISWNTGAEQVYGYAADEAIGQSVSIILPEDAREEEPEIRRALETGRRLMQFEVVRRRKDGAEIAVAITVSPLRDSKGRIVGSSSIERDITQRKRREEELEVAKEEAEAANRAKTEFLANISHELRTPMNAIIGMLELALGDELSPAMRDYLQTARESAHTLLYLLNDLLDFSRMEAGHFELEEEPFDLRETLDGTIKTLSLRAHEKGLELVCHVASSVPDRFDGDSNRLRQVIMNLAGNAIKFTEQGEVVLSVALERSLRDGVELLFSVKDTGVGISPENRERIFAPFTQVDSSTTRKQSGSGLGLAIVSELISKMGGRIWLESQPGRGTTFYCTARFRTLPEQDHATSIIPDLRGVPVLVVDDNESNRTILRETLSAWSMKPTVVSGGREAIAELRQAQRDGDGFPLVIVDGLMPDIDGFTLISMIEDEGLSKAAAVLMLSSTDRQLFEERCNELNIAAYLEKPVSQSDMLEAVVTALGAPHVAVQPARLDSGRAPRALHVLLAEDTPANQKVVKAILEKRGHRVEIADNGRKAIERHKQHEFDVILMDVQMPTMDGLQATAAIREMADETKSEIPIIAMTAHARHEDRLRCAAAGMDAYIAKPLDAGRLLRLVETIRRRSRLAEASPASAAVDVPATGSDGLTEKIGDESRLLPRPAEDVTDFMVNREAALSRLEGNEQLFGDMARFFLDDSPALLSNLINSLGAGEREAAARYAHSLKGLAANFDAAPVVQAAGSVEEAGRQGNLEQATARLPLLLTLVNRLQHELRRYLD